MEVDCNVESTPTFNVTKDHESASKPTSPGLRVQIDHLEKLMRCLDIEFATTKQKFDDLLSNKEITYNLLWCLFRQDSVVTFDDPESDLIMAGRITGTTYHESAYQKGFRITVRYINYNGTTFHYSSTFLKYPLSQM